jgi:lysozyme
MADVSSNNGPISLDHYEKAGHVAIAIKATQGTQYTNPYHLQQSETAHGLGLTVIHYHFCQPGLHDWTGELNHFRNTYSKGWRNGDQVVFDLEVKEVNNTETYISVMLDAFTRFTNQLPVLYTYESFRTEYLTRLRFKGDRWWIAKYSLGQPTLPKWANLWGWQYTDGEAGLEPHFYSGIGKCDGTVLSRHQATRFLLRKKLKR